jgi:DNA-binding response OmpR family regulator
LPYKILIVEDDKDIARLLETNLKDEKYEVTLAFDGKTGHEEALSKKYNLIILDLKLPEKDGLEICRNVRSSPEYTPILILTSMTTEMDRVLGLEIGADDYLTKPFSMRELLARVKALFRRMEALKTSSHTGKQEVIEVDELMIDVEKHEVTLRGNSVELTAKEFNLLLLFARHPRRVYTRLELLDLVWGYAYKGYEHTVNSHINRLRSKIEENPNQPHYILTVWGVGYKFFNPEEQK